MQNTCSAASSIQNELETNIKIKAKPIHLCDLVVQVADFSRSSLPSSCWFTLSKFSGHSLAQALLARGSLWIGPAPFHSKKLFTSHVFTAAELALSSSSLHCVVLKSPSSIFTVYHILKERATNELDSMHLLLLQPGQLQLEVCN